MTGSDPGTHALDVPGALPALTGRCHHDVEGPEPSSVCRQVLQQLPAGQRGLPVPGGAKPGAVVPLVSGGAS
jgi:hypothetical protein